MKTYLIHELGHALGLGHNLCRNSVMSYAKFADSMPCFTEIDLMQLRILYDPKLDKIYNNYQVIEDLDLDLDTYSEYADNSKCVSTTRRLEGFYRVSKRIKTNWWVLKLLKFTKFVLHKYWLLLNQASGWIRNYSANLLRGK